MGRTQGGAHLLLQVRTRVLNDEREATFRNCYPGCGSQQMRAVAFPTESNALHCINS